MPPVLRDYEITGVVLRQSTGVIYAGRYRKSGYPVSIEEIASDLRDTPGFTAGLADAGKRAATLRHPRVVGVYNLVDEGSCLALITDLVGGRPLRDIAPRGATLSAANALAVADDILSGVEEAHRVGVVHGDIRPEVVSVGPDGHAKLGGFAVAHAVATTPDAPAWRRAAYAADRAPGSGADEADDLFACAALAHELVTGAAPGEAEVVMPEAMRPVLMRAMSGLPKDRYPSATALRTALAEAAEAAYGVDWRASGDLAERAAGSVEAPQPSVVLSAAPRNAAPREPEPEPEPDPDPDPEPDPEPEPGPGPGPTVAEDGDHAGATVAPIATPPLEMAAMPAPPDERVRRPPPAHAPDRRVRTVVGAVVAAAVLAAAIAGYRYASGGSPAGAGPLGIGEVHLAVTPQHGGCNTTFQFVATGSVHGTGTLVYHFEPSEGPTTPDAPVTITADEGSFLFRQQWRFQDSRQFNGTMTFRILSPARRSATQPISYSCA